MMYLAGWLNPTRLIGLSAYSFASFCCAIAWIRCRRTPRLSRLAVALTVLEAGFLLDMTFSFRWQLHDLLEAEALREGLYARRVGPQLVALSLLSVVAVAGMGLVLQRLRGRTGAIVAACGAILSLSCWCAEVVSLHATDAVFYYTVDGVMLVGLCWVACSLMTGLGILWDARMARSHICQSAKSVGKPPYSFTGS